MVVLTETMVLERARVKSLASVLRLNYWCVSVRWVARASRLPCARPPPGVRRGSDLTDVRLLWVVDGLGSFAPLTG